MASRSETDLRLVIDHLPGLVSYVDRKFRYRFANQAYTDWFGLPQEKVVGATVQDVLGDEVWERLQPKMASALAGEVVRFETFLPHVRTGSKYVSVVYVPDRDSDTAVVQGFVVLVDDNTAHQRTEHSLRTTESYYRQLVETANEGIWIIDVAGKTIFANSRLAELLGVNLETLEGRTFYDFVFDEDHQEAAKLFEKKLAGDREPFEFSLRRSDGSPVWVRISGGLMINGGGEVIGLLGMFTDITAARAAELALRESEERFRTLLANLPDIVSRFDREGRFLYISPAVERATGRPPEAFLGKTHLEAGLPEDLANHLSERLEQIVQSGKPATVDFDMPRPGGEMLKYHGLGVPEFAPSGEVRTVLTIVHDVTDLRRAEQALRRSNADLEQFAYAAAHDLQEPLRVVGTYTELLLRRYLPHDDSNAHQISSFILKGVRQLQVLVRDLLEYSRAVHEDSHVLKPLSLEEALDTAIQSLDRENRAARIEREALPTVLGDCSQLAQVFRNILSNAIKYQEDGNLPVIRIWAEQKAAEWTISIHDNGIGFNPEYSEKIFGLFKRLHRETYPGTGVGLGICRRIVERHGGKIWAESEGEGTGATFRFTLKAAE